MVRTNHRPVEVWNEWWLCWRLIAASLFCWTSSWLDLISEVFLMYFSRDCVTCFDIYSTFTILKFIVKIRNMFAIYSLEEEPERDWLQFWVKGTERLAQENRCLKPSSPVWTLWKMCQNMFRHAVMAQHTVMAEKWKNVTAKGEKGSNFFKMAYIFSGKAASETMTRERPVQLKQLYSLLLSLMSSELGFHA